MLASGIRMFHPDPASKQSAVKFYSKNKFEKLEHLVAFIISRVHQVLTQLITLSRVTQNFEGIDNAQHNIFSYCSSALD